MRRLRKVKIVATLGPASNDYDTIRALFEAGADVFRLNMSHGDHDEIRVRHEIIRKIEKDTGRPIAILADLQGPKLRVGQFADSEGVDLQVGQAFRLDLDDAKGDATRVQLPHKERTARTSNLSASWASTGWPFLSCSAPPMWRKPACWPKAAPHFCPRSRNPQR